jgi:hypothetical protein
MILRRRVAPELSSQLAMVAASAILTEKLGFSTTGVCSICIRALEGHAFRDVQYDIRDRLRQGSDNPPVVDITDDSYGFTWMVIRWTPDNFQSLMHRVYTASSMFAEGGFGPQLLCSVTPFRDRGDRNVAVVYAYKRGRFYPFAPQTAETRNNQLELRVREVLQGRLPLEADVRRWYPVWGAPGL